MTNNRKQRVWKFIRVFSGIAYDFRKEAKLAKKIGIKKARKRMSVRHRKRAVQFKMAALELGGVLVKLGQFFSARADIMPEEYLLELAQLQDEMPPVPYDEVRKVIEDSFGIPIDRIFKKVEAEPIAAASLAQVHLATLQNGEEVAVKVQRPLIEKLCDIDLATFSWLMEGVDRFSSWGKRADIPGLVTEFKRTLGDELDFLREASYAEIFRNNFQGSEEIYIPRVHWEYTNERVITLEKIDGVKISDYEQLEKHGFNRTEIAKRVVNSYLHQGLIDGFFHADPHPGNLFIMGDGRVAFVDFGMAGEITDAMRGYLKDAVIAIARKDIPGLIISLQNLGFIKRGANIDPIRKALYWTFDNYQNLNATNIDFKMLDSIQEDIRAIVYEQPFSLPVEFAFFARAVGTVIGVVMGLDPKFDIVEAARPYIEKIARNMRPNTTELVLSEAKSIGSLLLNMPRRVDDTLSQIEHGNLKVKVANSELAIAMKRTERAQKATARAVIGSAFFLSAILLNINNQTTESFALFALSLMLIFSSIFSIRANEKRG